MHYQPSKLSVKEEIEYLKQALALDECLGYGSSRIVFAINDDTVIKVALDNRGQMQNKHELDFYEEQSDLCGDILYYGSHILVCDRMVEDYSDAVMDLMEDFCEDDGDEELIKYLREEYKIKDEQEIQNIITGFRVAMDMCDIMGYTADNGQVGYFVNGYVAAYDYGYYPAVYEPDVNSEIRHNRQVGDVDSIMCRFSSAEALLFVIDKLKHKAKRIYYDRQKKRWAVKSA